MSVGERIVTTARASAPALSGRAVDRIFVVLAGWLMTGVFLDAWAHISRLPDSFWTPWHGVLYSGLLACGAFLVVARSAQRATGRTFLASGYDLSLVGFALGAIGGVGDAVWHTAFGVEFDIEAAVSPSHLAIAFGICLVVTGPARAAWSRRSFGVSGTLSLLYGLSILTVIIDYANPFGRVFGSGGATVVDELAQAQQTAALFAFMFYAALIAGAALLAIRHGGIAPWCYALAIGGNAAAMTLVNSPLHPESVGLLLFVAVASAMLIGLAAGMLRPSPARVTQARAFAFLVPAMTYAVYAITVAAVAGTWWSVTFWTGLVALGGIMGALLSAIALPGVRPASEERI